MRPLRPALLLVPLAIACSSNIPTAPAGDRITGTIYYDGNVKSFRRPVIQVVAAVEFPPTRVPHGSLLIENPDFSAGIPYELAYLPKQPCKIAAQLADLADPGLDDTMKPLGGYPDNCSLLMAPEVGLVEINEDTPTTGIDLRLYDSGGMEDPCWAAVAP